LERINGNNQQKECATMKRKTLIENQNGATVVEFAIILPLVIVFIFGIIEFGLLLYNKQVITNASREGARVGIVAGLDRANNQHTALSLTTATNYCSSRLVTFSDNTTPLSINAYDTGLFFGDDLIVDVSYDYGFLILSNFGLGPITLQEVTTMKLE
jgi:hypothetical protein